MRFGYFDDEHLEYKITRPDTPLPWINYLGCEDYFGIISNTAGGYSFYKDARLRRLTRYRYNNVPGDMGGRYIYVRENDSHIPAADSFWSPTWQPVKKKLDEYTCCHGLGYTRISSIYRGIQTAVCYFVPIGESLEIWDVHIKNTRAEKVDLSLFSAIEFCLWDALDDATNFQRNLSIGEVEVVGNVIYHKSEYRERRNHFAFFTCSEKINGFETQREDFLGPYRGWDDPRAVEEDQMHASIAHGWAPVGSHQLKFSLKAGEEKRFIFLLGYHENLVDDKFEKGHSQVINKKTVLPIIQKYTQFTNVDAAFQELKNYWKNILEHFQVDTPNGNVNRMVNIWNAYQVMTTFNISRSASLFESGIGRGMGFRDSNQDLLGFCMLDPQRARSRIIDLAATQLTNGGAYHQYQPLTKTGNNNIGGGFNDDSLWLVLTVAAYIKETADWTVLEENIPFDNDPATVETLYAHLQRALQYTLDRRGPHDLPLIGRADWNDCLNLNCFSDSPGQSFQTTTNREGKTAESVFIAGLFVLAASEMIRMAAHYTDAETIAKYNIAMEDMEAVLAKVGWDGKWFRRAYDFFGEPVGSHLNKEGKIFIEPQGLCVMAGFGLQDGKAKQALDSVAQYLATTDGIMLLQPAFTSYQLHLGEISSYPPGYKENASIFCHTNPWIMIAETMIGRGDRALDYYLRINPSTREEKNDIYKCEPYVYAQTISGRDAVLQGEAKNSWLTGAAAWNYVAISQWILGIRPEYEGLRIAPCIPKDWSGFSVKRLFRGVLFNIKIERRGEGNKITLFIDGEALPDNILRIGLMKKKEVEVLAVLE